MRQILLARRPTGMISNADFQLVEVPQPELGQDEVAVRALWFSVDPYLRGRMNDARSYVPPFAVGEPLASSAIGEVVASNDASFVVGDTVSGQLPWSEISHIRPSHLTKVEATPSIPLQWYLGALGMPGLTAYVGLKTIGAISGGESVFISGAAGAVGSVAGQIAKLHGCTVLGSAGSPEKVRAIKDVGFDEAWCYRTQSPMDGLKEYAPGGIDMYFDNVGGDHLEAALAWLNDFGVAVLCGAISNYNATESVPGPRNFATTMVRKRLRTEGFIVSDHWSVFPTFLTEMSQWITAGKVKVLETVVEGFESLPSAFEGLFRGENIGKMVVKV